MRIVIFSCAGAPLSGETLDYVRRNSCDVLQEIVGMVLSRPQPKQARAETSSVKRWSGNTTSFLQHLSQGIGWRFRKLIIHIGVKTRHILVKFKRLPYKRIEDVCLDLRIKPHVTDHVNTDATVRYLHSCRPDLIVVATFHYLLKPIVFNIPTIATVNVHPSYLPEYRGADPINDAIRDGAKETGVTIHWIDEGVDTGDIVLQRKISLRNAKSEKEVRKRLSKVAGKLLIELIEQARSGTLQRIPQSRSPTING